MVWVTGSAANSEEAAKKAQKEKRRILICTGGVRYQRPCRPLLRPNETGGDAFVTQVLRKGRLTTRLHFKNLRWQSHFADHRAAYLTIDNLEQLTSFLSVVDG